GTIWTRPSGRGSHRIAYATISPGLADDVVALLLRLGIVARHARIPQGRHRPIHHVVVTGAETQLRFLDLVGAFGPRQPQADRLRSVLAGVRPNTNVDTPPVQGLPAVKRALARG